jgi:hypothetical protein
MLLRKIMLVIARITQAMGGATSTQPAGRAPQGHTTQTGKVSSVSAATKPRPQPASKSAKRKPSVAKPTTAVKSRKAAPKPAQTTSGKRGRPRKIAA